MDSTQTKALMTRERASPPLNVLLFGLGSRGDVHPFFALGQALQARGHHITFLTLGYFSEQARRLGFEVVEVGSADDYLKWALHPDLWHPRRGFRVMAEITRLISATIYREIEARYEPRRTVIVGTCSIFAARVAQEKLGVPLVTAVLQPALFFSTHESPTLQPFMAGINRYPRWVRRLAMGAAGLTMDRALGPAVNEFRASVGLPPVRNLCDWWFSPQAVVPLFPEWFAAPQPDWPANLRMASFPFYDGSNFAAPSEELAEFIASGDPPLVFTPGSGARNARQFFTASVEACRLLKRRGILLTPFEDQIPPLSDEVRHEPFVNLEWLLPRSAAMIHHGGIGTAADALRAGRPQLLMPMAFDQPDNAARLRRLGVGRSLAPRHFTGPRVARVLSALLESAEVASRCRDYANRLQGAMDLRVGCELIESLGG